MFSRSQLEERLKAAFADPQRLRALLQQANATSAEAPGLPTDTDPSLPADVVNWLSRLTLLQGVPFPYLVPDEGMLPPESIRFFYVNLNWIDAMVDGALSLGRNLTAAGSSSASEALDEALRPPLTAAVRARAGTARRRALGLPDRTASLQVVSGFLLRSAVVEAYPGLGVNAYPQGGTPNDPTITLLPILRLEQLGTRTGVLLGLIDGDAAQIDIHEPPEGLHYGLDSYSDAGNGVSASKSIHTFTRSGPNGSTVTMSPTATPLSGVSACFRSASPRVLMMSSLAALIAQANKVPEIDSAVMGFEMTEGVGQVSFLRRSS